MCGVHGISASIEGLRSRAGGRWCDNFADAIGTRQKSDARVRPTQDLSWREKTPTTTRTTPTTIVTERMTTTIDDDDKNNNGNGDSKNIKQRVTCSSAAHLEASSACVRRSSMKIGLLGMVSPMTVCIAAPPAAGAMGFLTGGCSSAKT